MKRVKGFTLVELLVVMAILGILVTLIGANFRSAQIRGRDGQRKSDLKQIANALELFYNDYSFYPDADGSGRILACPYDQGAVPGICDWGVGKFVDMYYDGESSTEKTIYFRKLPEDVVNGYSYYYRNPGSSNSKFQLFARVENTEDQDCMGGDCAAPSPVYSCGTVTCNFSITSSNTSYDEE